MAPERGLPEDVYALPAVSVAPAAIAARRARAPAGLLRQGDGHLERPTAHLGGVHLADGLGRLPAAGSSDLLGVRWDNGWRAWEDSPTSLRYRVRHLAEVVGKAVGVRVP